MLTLPAVHYGYLLEDYKYLRSYSLSEILHGFYSHWEPTLNESKGYRPFHAVHYAFFHWLIGGNPLNNHILKTALLLGATLLIYLFAWRCTRNQSAAFWAALIYNCLGGNAWRASWINHRYHILQVQLVILSLLAFDQFLDRKKISSWFLSLVFFLIAFLFKEEVVTFPLVLAAYALIIKRVNLRSLLRPLLPFFLLAVFLVLMRSVVTRNIVSMYPPPVSWAPGDLFNKYGYSLISTANQTFGTYDPENWEFPLYGGGIKTLRDYIGVLSLLGFVILGGLISLKRGTVREKKTFGFGMAFLLLSTAIVSAWYRNDRLYISSIGVGLMLGTIVSIVFMEIGKIAVMRKKLLRTGSVLLAILFFLTYLSANLSSFFEIQVALKPTGTISLLWDTWVYQGYLPWMKPEQMEIFRDKLLRSERTEWAAQITNLLKLMENDKVTPEI